MADIRGQTSEGKPREVLVDNAGRLITRSRLTAQTEFGDDQGIVASLAGVLTTGTRTYATPFVPIPGIGAGVAYADEDAFGTLFSLEMPKSGVIQTALAVDDDDEDVNVDLFLFRSRITTGTDNDAFAPSINELLLYEGVVTLSTRKGVSGATVTINAGLNHAYVAPEGRLYVQAVARGALNIAAGKRYFVALRIAEA